MGRKRRDAKANVEDVREDAMGLRDKDTARRPRPRNGIRVWESSLDGDDGLVCVAVWGVKPNGYYGLTHAFEIRTASDWNGVLDRLEEVLP